MHTWLLRWLLCVVVDCYASYVGCRGCCAGYVVGGIMRLVWMLCKLRNGKQQYATAKQADMGVTNNVEE